MLNGRPKRACNTIMKDICQAIFLRAERTGDTEKGVDEAFETLAREVPGVFRPVPNGKLPKLIFNFGLPKCLCIIEYRDTFRGRDPVLSFTEDSVLGRFLDNGRRPTRAAALKAAHSTSALNIENESLSSNEKSSSGSPSGLFSPAESTMMGKGKVLISGQEKKSVFSICEDKCTRVNLVCRKTIIYC